MVTAEFVSAHDGIAWPALPPARASAVLAILFQLEQSQWWPAERLETAQRRQMARLLEHARAQVPVYAERLAKFNPAETALNAERWADLPILRRADIQAAQDALHAASLPAGHGKTVEIFTSGSTGRPIRALRTQLWEVFWSAVTLRDHLWHRRDLTGKLAAIRESGKGKAPYPDGTTAPHWGRSSSPVFRTGPSVSLNITCSVEQQLEWLQRQDPDYLLSHPSMIDRLAERSLADGVRLPRLKQVETISEILRPETRRLCREAWGVPLVDLYSAREAGYLALQCPEQEHYHVQSETTLVEVLDEAGRPCPPGGIGRVVVTPLHNFAMPLIRYEIGDYAEVGPPCPCGRGLPVLARIVGRRQNMLRLPSGAERWPLLSSTDIRALLSLAPIRQYQFVQKTPELIVLRLAVARALDATEEAALAAWVQEKFGYPFAVAFEYRDELARNAAGKFEDFVCEIDG